MELRTANVTRYIMPLREGGSLPALAEADDEFKYVVKFRGAGHGTKALIAELIGGEIARCLGFHVPELVFLNLDEAFGRSEGDEEIQDLLQAIKDHVLLPQATLLEEVNKDFKRILTEEKIREIVGLVPDDWLHWNDSPGTPQEIRDVYIRFLIDRIAHSDTFINEARHARQTLI